MAADKPAIEDLQETLDGKMPPTSRKLRRQVQRAAHPAEDQSGRAERRRRRANRKRPRPLKLWRMNERQE